MSSVWDNVPAEIYDEIFSHIAYPISSIDNYTTRPYSDDYVHTFEYIRYVGRTGPFGYAFRNYPKPGEMQLRLVCRAFDRAMTRAYFKHEDTILRPWEASNIQRIRDFIINEKSTIAPLVSHLRIELSPLESYRSGPSLFEHDRSWSYDDNGENSKVLNLMNASLRAFLPMTEDVVARLPKLESIIIEVPEHWRSDRPAYPDSDTSEPGEGELEDLRLMVELDLLELVRNSIATIFSSPRISLPFLTYLRLTLPSAYDFAIIGTNISDSMALQLRHLYLEYIDGTGPGGSLEYTQDWQGDPDSDGDEEQPYSNLQNRFSNTTYMSDMCKLINRCRNLESLGLRCTQSINLEFLNWQPTTTGLKNIYICRGITPADKLLSLISTSVLISFHIEDISLVSGTWVSVFDRLLSCPSLKYASVYNLIYDRFGESREFAERNNRPWENVNFIWTEVDEDWKRFRDLIRALQSRGGIVNGNSAMEADELDKRFGEVIPVDVQPIIGHEDGEVEVWAAGWSRD